MRVTAGVKYELFYYFIYLFTFLVISKGNIPLSFDILELSEVVKVIFFLFFFNYLGTRIWEILRMKSLVYLIWFLFELNFSSFFFFFKYLETDMYIYISSKYFTLIIFHIGTRLKYLKFRGLRARTEIWIIPFYILQFLCKYFRLNIRILLYKYLKKK